MQIVRQSNKAPSLRGAKIADRLAFHSDRSGGAAACWIWLGKPDHKGYGRLFLKNIGRPRRAHRLSYEETHGPIPSGISVLHRCDNRRCINPAHLFLGTKTDNHADMVAKGRHSRGAHHGSAKIDATAAIAIFRSKDPAKIEAARWGICRSQVSAIRTGRNWGFVTGEAR